MKKLMKSAKAFMSGLGWYVTYRLEAWHWSSRCASNEDGFDELAQANKRAMLAALRGNN
jgi:hypothetical protein